MGKILFKLSTVIKVTRGESAVIGVKEKKLGKKRGPQTDQLESGLPPVAHKLWGGLLSTLGKQEGRGSKGGGELQP